jgi:hypothetical protein
MLKIMLGQFLHAGPGGGGGIQPPPGCGCGEGAGAGGIGLPLPETHDGSPAFGVPIVLKRLQLSLPKNVHDAQPVFAEHASQQHEAFWHEGWAFIMPDGL